MVTRILLETSPFRLRASAPGVDVSTATGLDVRYDSNWFSNFAIRYKGFSFHTGVANNADLTVYTLPTLDFTPMFFGMIEYTGNIAFVGTQMISFMSGLRLDAATKQLKALINFQPNNNLAPTTNVRITYCVLDLPLNALTESTTPVSDTPRMVMGDLGGFQGLRITPPGVNALTAPSEQCNLDSAVRTAQIITRESRTAAQVVNFTPSGFSAQQIWRIPCPHFNPRSSTHYGRWVFLAIARNTTDGYRFCNGSTSLLYNTADNELVIISPYTPPMPADTVLDVMIIWLGR